MRIAAGLEVGDPATAAPPPDGPADGPTAETEAVTADAADETPVEGETQTLPIDA